MTISTDKINTMKGGKPVELNGENNGVFNNIINSVSSGNKVKVPRQIKNITGTAANKISDVAASASKVAYDAVSTVSNSIGNVAASVNNTASDAASTASKNITLTNPFKDLNVFYPFIIVIVLLVIILFMVLFNIKIPFTSSSPPKSNEETVSNIFIVLFFTLLVVGICIVLLPNFKDLKKLFEQISNVTYVIIYTIFLILFFTMTPSDTINNYAYIITPITILLGIFMFYKGYSENYATEFNVNYERIKTMILLFCLITIFIIYYNIDPGGYIQKNFGYTLLLTIIVTVFAFLYLMIVLTLSNKTGTTSGTSDNLLNSFSSISTYGSLGFLLFIIIITITILTYPGGFFNSKSISAFGMIMVLIISILWCLLLGFNLFPEIDNNVVANDKMSLFKRSLLALFGLVISSLVIFWIVYNIQNLSGNSSIVRFVLNLILVAIVLGLIYKTIVVRLPVGNEKKNSFFSLILNLIFYIPCLFSGVFDFAGKHIAGEYQATTKGSILMLIAIIGLILLYFKTPSVFNKINLQGGNQLVNKPVYTDTQYALGTYEQLNGSDKFDYQYAISFWLFLDAAPPNTNDSYSRYTSLLNFGNKPNILYKGETNTLIVTMQQKDLNKVNKSNLIDFDEDGNRIIYKNTNMLLQKWNNIIINYNGGVLDIFLNGELVKSTVGVVPYYTLDNLTIGQDNGIKGGICNVTYFKQALTAPNIYYLYNMVKDRNPPVLNDSNETIMKENVNTVSNSASAIS